MQWMFYIKALSQNRLYCRKISYGKISLHFISKIPCITSEARVPKSIYINSLDCVPLPSAYYDSPTVYLTDWLGSTVPLSN